MTVEEFEEFIEKPLFEVAMELMSKEEFLLWAGMQYDKSQTSDLNL